MEAHPQIDAAEALAELEVLVFGSTLDDQTLAQKFLAADTGFNAHLIAKLAREPIVLH